MKLLYALDDLRRRPRAWAMSCAAAALVALVTWALGGFEAVPAATLPRPSAGSVITTNQWTLRPLRAWVGESSPAGRKRSDGSKVLILEVDVTSRMPATSNLAGNAFHLSLPGVTGQSQGEPKLLELLRDPSIGADLHPGMTERIAAVWEVAPTAPIPTAVDVTVVNWTFKRQDSLMGSSGWFNPTPIAVVPMPIENRIAPESAPAATPAPAAAPPVALRALPRPRAEVRR